MLSRVLSLPVDTSPFCSRGSLAPSSSTRLGRPCLGAHSFFPPHTPRSFSNLPTGLGHLLRYSRFLEIEITLLQGMARTLISRLLNVAYLWHARNLCLAVSKSASSDKRKSIQCMCHDSNNLVTKESKPTYISDLTAVCFAPIYSCVAPRQAMAKVHPRAQRIPPIGPQ